MPSHDLYVFDAYGTLLDVHSAVGRHATRLGDAAAAVSALWRQRQLEYSWIAGLSGRYRPFWELTREALDYALSTHGIIDDGLKADLLAAYRSLSAYPEVPEVLAGLKASGAKTAILSNGNPEMLGDAVESAGLTDLLDAVLSVDGLQTFKPDPPVYQSALDHFGLTEPGAVAFHTSNAWDGAGAASFGFTVRWINRTSAPVEYQSYGTFDERRDLRGI